jgi:Na+-transporting methylmalonyl-CoA/oxaloacetate decarboxylase gamma subunit
MTKLSLVMTNNLLLALQITALGMGLVFGAIILLWWVMNVLTAITTDKPSASEPAESVPVMDNDARAQAAAVAVAIAFAEQQSSVSHPLPEPPTAIVSAWQLGMRTRQLYEKRAPTIKPRRQDHP